MKEIGVHDNFFELGGHSLLATQVISRLRNAFDAEIPLLSIFLHPVLTDLAAAVDQGQLAPAEGAAARDFYTLVPIQPAGTRPPFFWFHSQLVSFLPGYLGQNQPVYAFIAQGVDGRRARYRTTKDITAHYLRELRAVQPSGPYYLGGFCWGAQISFAIASQLIEQGEDVALLFLVEPTLSSASSKQHILEELRHRINLHRKELVRLSFSGKVIYVTKELLKRAQVFRLLSEAYLLAGRPVPLSLRVPYALDVIHRASRDFIQTPCPRGIIVAQAEKGIHPAGTDWSNLAEGGVTVHVAQGATHMDMLQEPGAGFWAEWLDKYLRQAQTKYSGLQL